MKVVLAFSGGLDTSYCAAYLSKDMGFEVHAVTINTGGFSQGEKNELKNKALALGVAKYSFIDKTHAFYEKGIKYLIFGNVLKNNTYPLSVSAERVFQAVAIADYANETNADAIAHGSTGAGNDQIRFDVVFHALCPNKKIITPIRDHQLSRTKEIEYLRKNGVTIAWEKAQYSINKGLWGISVGGKETLTSNEYLPEEAFPSQIQKNGHEVVMLDFEKGEPVGLNGKKTDPVSIIQQLEETASAYAIGRDIHVGDTIIGIKGRVGFQAAAPVVIIKAHHALEKHVLSRHQLFFKDQIAMWYGNLMHEGQYLDPAMRDIESFLISSQASVNGQVQVKLSPYRFHVIGVNSTYDLMHSSFGSYGEMNKAWTADDAKGFSKILSNQLRILNGLKND